MKFSDLGFGYPDSRGRVFVSRERRIFAAETSPRANGVVHSTHFPPSRVARIPVAIAHGEHTDNWRAKLSFRVRVPNLGMFRRHRAVTNGEVVLDATLPPEAWVQIDAGTPLLVPTHQLPNLLPDLPLPNRPRVHQATRLIRRLRVLAGDREEVLFDQPRFDLVAEVKRWQTDGKEEPTTSTPFIASTSSFPVVVPNYAMGAPPAASGVDMCSTPEDVDALYSHDGLAVSLTIPLSFFGSKGFWPGVEAFVVEIEFNDALEAFNIDTYNRDLKIFQAPPLAMETPPQIAAQYHRPGATLLPIDSSRFGYEIFGLTYDTDVVVFSPEAQNAVAEALAANTLHTTYEAHSLFETNLAESHRDLQIRCPAVLSNIVRWQTFFRRASRARDVYFDSYDMVNPAIRAAQWWQGNVAINSAPLGLEELFRSALSTKDLWHETGRVNRTTFFGEVGARSNVDDWNTTSDGGRLHVTFQPARCFMLVANLERDREGDADERKISGRSSGEDLCLSLRVTRGTPIVSPTFLVRALPYRLVRWPGDPRQQRPPAVLYPNLLASSTWPYIPRFARGFGDSYEMLSCLRTRMSWCVSFPYIKEENFAANGAGVDARLYDARDFNTVHILTGVPLAPFQQNQYMFPAETDYYTATTIVDHTRVITWGQYGQISAAE